MRISVSVPIIFVLLFFIQACASTVIKNTYNNKHITSANVLPDTVYIKKADTTAVYSVAQMEGTYTHINKEYLTVKISRHTFTYLEHHQKLSYTFKADTVAIVYFKDTFGGRPYFINDTLILLDNKGNCLKFVRKR
jgi:hypothetical protein